MTTIEKIMLAGFIIMAFFFVVDMLLGLIFGYIEAKHEVERERKMDIILEFLENDLGDSVFPEFEDKE